MSGEAGSPAGPGWHTALAVALTWVTSVCSGHLRAWSLLEFSCRGSRSRGKGSTCRRSSFGSPDAPRTHHGRTVDAPVRDLQRHSRRRQEEVSVPDWLRCSRSPAVCCLQAGDQEGWWGDSAPAHQPRILGWSNYEMPSRTRCVPGTFLSLPPARISPHPQHCTSLLCL